MFGIDYWFGTNHFEFGVSLHVSTFLLFHVASRSGPVPRGEGQFYRGGRRMGEAGGRKRGETPRRAVGDHRGADSERRNAVRIAGA